MTTRRTAALALAFVVGLSAASIGQVKTNVPDPVPGARPATVERIKIHGKALEGNLEGDAVDRDVIVLPAAQLRARADAPLSGRLRAARLLDRRRAVDAGNPRAADDRRARSRRARHEMIVVLPDSKTVHNGSMYSSSATTGDFENFIARDVVSYIDAHYRTIAIATAAASSATRWAATAQRVSA